MLVFTWFVVLVEAALARLFQILDLDVVVGSDFDVAVGTVLDY